MLGVCHLEGLDGRERQSMFLNFYSDSLKDTLHELVFLFEFGLLSDLIVIYKKSLWSVRLRQLSWKITIIEQI